MYIKPDENYFYLQHSFRKGGKVITRSIYLGKKIPPDVEEIRKKFIEQIKEEVKDDPSCKGVFKKTKL